MISKKVPFVFLVLFLVLFLVCDVSTILIQPNGGWSAPSAIASAGMGWGAQIGGELTDFMIIIRTKGSCFIISLCEVYLRGHCSLFSQLL